MNDKVRVIGVAWNGSPDAMNDFIAKHKLSFPNIEDTAGNVFAQFNVPHQPAWVFITRDGTFETAIGAMNEVALTSALTRLGDS